MGTFKEILSQKAGLLGVITLLILVALATWAPIRYGKYYQYWRNTTYWSLYPKAVPPEWINLFSSVKLPTSIFLKNAKVNEKTLYGVAKQLTYTFTLYYNYDVPPSDVMLILNAKYNKSPVVTVYLVRPDGERVKLLQGSISNLQQVISFNNDEAIKNSLYSWLVSKGFDVPDPSAIVPSNAMFCKLSQGCWAHPEVMKGKYKMEVQLIGLGNFSA